jgi:hypothetical protein
MSAIAPTMYDGLSTRKKTCRIHDGNGTSRQMRSKIGFALKLIRDHILGPRTARAPLFPLVAAFSALRGAHVVFRSLDRRSRRQGLRPFNPVQDVHPRKHVAALVR